MKTIIALIASSLIALSAWASQAVNINTASAEEISEALQGIGPSKAEAIVAYRSANGQFQHIDELVNVKGIGLRTIELNREYILLQDRAQAASEKP
jgi:competence protein ComEA